MRKIRYVFFILFIVITAYGCLRRDVVNMESSGANIICYGDSITFGVGSSKTENYPAILSRLTGRPVINAGASGETAGEGLKRIDLDVLQKDPLLVIIEFGGNDFMRKVPLEDTVKNIEEMIKKIQEKNAMVALADISSSIIMTDYGIKYKELSNKYNIIFVPNLLDGIITDPEKKSDFVHPNSLGYRIIAHRIYRAIMPYLNRNALIRNIKGK